MKSPNLTQINLRNDPINRRIQGYSFRNSEDEVWCSRCDCIQFSRSKFEFQHSIEAQMGYAHRETNGTRFGVFSKENLKKFREQVLRREERNLYKTKSIVSRPMKRWSRSTVVIVRPFGWTVVLSWASDLHRVVEIQSEIIDFKRSQPL